MSFLRNLFQWGGSFQQHEGGVEGVTSEMYFQPESRKSSVSVRSTRKEAPRGTDETWESFEFSSVSLQERYQINISDPQASALSRELDIIAIGSQLYDEGAGSLISPHSSEDSGLEIQYRAHLSPRAHSSELSKLATSPRHAGDGRASNSSDGAELCYLSDGEFIYDLQNRLKLLERPALPVWAPRQDVTLHETILLSTATKLADLWLADQNRPFPARFPFPFVYDQFDQDFPEAPSQFNHSISGILVCGNSANNTSRPPGSNERDGQDGSYTLNSNDKRPRDHGRDDEDDGEGTDGTDGRQPGPSKNKKQCISQLLACPFYKRHPLRYSAHNMREIEYRGCAARFLSNISRLK